MPAFLQAAKKMDPVYKMVYSIFMTICKVLLVADIIITSWIVLARHSGPQLGRGADPDADVLYGSSVRSTCNPPQRTHSYDRF